MHFGIEIEFASPFSRKDVASALRKTKLRARTDYADTPADSEWKVISDGSLDYYQEDDDDNSMFSVCEPLGLELVSPILNYPKDLPKIKRAMQVLVDLGCRPTKKCGIHIHADCGEFTTYQKIWLAAKYAHHEKTIDQFVPATRRGNKNAYCKSMGNPEMLMRSMFMSIGLDWSIDKDCKVGLHKSVLIPGDATIEFRQYHSSLNYEEVKHWIHFVMGQMKAASKVKTPEIKIPKDVVETVNERTLQKFKEQGIEARHNSSFIGKMKQAKVEIVEVEKYRIKYYVPKSFLDVEFGSIDLWKDIPKKTADYYKNQTEVRKVIGRDKESSY